MAKQIPGTIYRNGSRWWWRVRLPGEAKPKARPLRPAGARYATQDRAVAEEVAKAMWEEAIWKQRTGERRAAVRTIDDLIAAFLAWADDYYQDARGQRTLTPDTFRWALRRLRRHSGRLLVEDFTAKRLLDYQRHLAREGLARPTVNKWIGVVRRMFRWAVGEELVRIRRAALHEPSCRCDASAATVDGNAIGGVSGNATDRPGDVGQRLVLYAA